jgi:hypothetical protein
MGGEEVYNNRKEIRVQTDRSSPSHFALVSDKIGVTKSQLSFSVPLSALPRLNQPLLTLQAYFSCDWKHILRGKRWIDGLP